jgi:hypothetical protein
MVPGEDLAIQITQPFLVGLVRGLESLGTERSLSEMICRSPYVFEKKNHEVSLFHTDKLKTKSSSSRIELSDSNRTTPAFGKMTTHIIPK